MPWNALSHLGSTFGEKRTSQAKDRKEAGGQYGPQATKGGRLEGQSYPLEAICTDYSAQLLEPHVEKGHANFFFFLVQHLIYLFRSESHINYTPPKTIIANPWEEAKMHRGIAILIFGPVTILQYQVTVIVTAGRACNRRVPIRVLNCSLSQISQSLIFNKTEFYTVYSI